MEEKFDLITQAFDSLISYNQDFSRRHYIEINNLVTNQSNFCDNLRSLQEIISNTKSATVLELIKDRIDHDRERRNCVIWDLELHSLRKYSKLKSDHEITNAFAYDFIRKYIGSVDKRDFKAKRLGIDDNEKKKKYFRLLVTFTDISTAQKLIGRCLHEGFRKIRSGLTKMERELIFRTKRNVEKLNLDRNPNSDHMFTRKYMYKIIKVSRSDPNQVMESIEDRCPSAPNGLLEDCGDHNEANKHPSIRLNRTTRKSDNITKRKITLFKHTLGPDFLKSPLPTIRSQSSANQLPPVGD